MKAQGDAARDAARIMAESADKALGFEREIWEKQQRDFEPWQRSGTAAVNTLSARMGLPGYEGNAPPASYSLRQTGMPQPGQRYPGVQPLTSPSGMPDFDAAAERYRRRA